MFLGNCKKKNETMYIVNLTLGSFSRNLAQLLCSPPKRTQQAKKKRLMASFIVFPNAVSSPFRTNLHHIKKKCPLPDSILSLCVSLPPPPAKIHFGGLGFASNISSSCRKRKLVVVGAGPPSTTSLLFAFVFPLSLLLVTIFTSIRIADKLDQQYLEEVIDQTHPPSHFHFLSNR